MVCGMGSGKLNDMRKTWYGHKNRSSLLVVEIGAVVIVDRPANKGGKLKMSIQQQTSEVTRGRSDSGSNRMHSIWSNTPCCIDKSWH